MAGEKRRIREWIWNGIWTAVAAVCLCAVCPVTAWADLIWTPQDSFYEEHDRDCDYVGRRYYANGDKGYVTVMQRPGEGAILDFIPNGEIFYVSMSYDKGGSGTWGVVQYKMDSNNKPVADYSWEEGATTGWIDMDSLVVVYDGKSFAEEHAAEIRKTDDASMLKVTMPDTGRIYLWSYPGSEAPYDQLNSLENQIEFDQTYEDPDGNLWGHTGYYYGRRDFWVNLSDPGDEHAGAKPYEKPVLTPAMDPADLEKLPKTGGPDRLLAGAVFGLIVLVVALTGGIIYKMSVKRREDSLN